MAYEFKKLSDVNVIESTNENAHVLAEQDGEIVRIPASSVGGGLPSGGAPHQQLVTDADGVVKWEDKPFYETFAYGSESYGTDGFNSVEVGGLYKMEDAFSISLDASKQYIVEQYPGYVCDVKTADGMKYIGNITIFGFGEDTGEPFIVLENPDTGMAAVVLKEAPTSKLFSVHDAVKTIETIDPKYLPDIGNSISVVFMALNAEPDDHGWSCTEVTCNKSVDDIYAAFKSGTNIDALLAVESSFMYLQETIYNLRLSGKNDDGLIFTSLGCDISYSDAGDMYIQPNPVKVVYVVMGDSIAARCTHFSTNSGLE